MKRKKAQVEKSSVGTVVGAQYRARCNALSASECEKVNAEFLKLYYAGNPRQPARPQAKRAPLLIEEGLRRDEFAFIDFRDSSAGHQAYIQGSTLAVWEVVWIASGYKDSLEKTAAHLCMSPLKVKAALNYIQAFLEEIRQAVQAHKSSDFASLSRMLPQAEIFPSVKRK